MSKLQLKRVASCKTAPGFSRDSEEGEKKKKKTEEERQLAGFPGVALPF